MKQILIALALLVAGCASMGEQRSPIGEYLAGVEDALLEARPDKPPTIVVTFDVLDQGSGACRRVSGEPVIYLHVGHILKQAKSVQEARLLVAEVLAHELAHAKMTCSDADHSEGLR